MKKILLLAIALLNLFGFEVNTHQALTRCAIENECGNGYTKNLYDFATHSELNTVNPIYENEIFEKYNVKYKDYVAQDNTGFEDWNIKLIPNYLGMIEAGSVLEDAVYPRHDFAGDGRFNNHFYADQFLSNRGCPFASSMRTDRALCYGYGMRTDNIDWVFNDSVSVNHGERNAYGLSDAFVYFKKSFEGDLASRRKYQAKLFVTLGHIVHMLQDLHSPAHCRDNSHAKGDYLEIYGRYNGGFNLRDGKFNSTNNSRIVNAIKSYGSSRYLLSQNRYYTYEDFFKKEAAWVSHNFASESHFRMFENINTQTGEGLLVGNLLDSSSLFDGKNIHPSKSETFEGGTINGYERWAYVYTEGNTVSGYVKGPILSDARRIGLVHKGWLFDTYHMVAPRYGWVQGGVVLRQTGLNKQPLEDTAVNVMPRAVASTQAFIDFFFRGQIETRLDKNGKMYITNVSKADTLSDASLATLKKGGKFYLYYDNNGVYTHFSTWSLSDDLPIGDYAYLSMGTKVFSDKPKGTKIVVLFEGNIGDNKSGNNSYRIGTKGLSVDVTTVPDMPDNDQDNSNSGSGSSPTSYTFKIWQAHTPAIDQQYPNGYWSFFVNIYKNGTFYKQEILNSLLHLGWYNGSAHFKNSSAHHYDVWCEGSAQLCNYLRKEVPTDSTVPYQNWHIDWTIWENNIVLFNLNIRNAIAKYYALVKYRSYGKRMRSKAYNDANEGLALSEDQNITIVYHLSDDTEVMAEPDTGNDGEIIEADEEMIESQNAEEESSSIVDLTAEEQAEMDKIAAEERGE